MPSANVLTPQGRAPCHVPPGCAVCLGDRHRNTGTAGHGRRFGDSGRYQTHGALTRTKNGAEASTVHEIVNSGVYDYLVIPIDDDLDYPDAKSSINAYKTDDSKQEPAVYAVIDHDRQWKNTRCGGGVWNYTELSCVTFNPDSSDSVRSVNIMVDMGGGGGIRLYMQNCRTSGGAKDCSGPASLVGWNGHLLCEERVSGELGVGGRFWILPACNNNPAVPEGWRLPDRSSCRGITWRVLGSQGAPRRPPSYINGWG